MIVLLSRYLVVSPSDGSRISLWSRSFVARAPLGQPPPSFPLLLRRFREEVIEINAHRRSLLDDAHRILHAPAGLSPKFSLKPISWTEPRWENLTRLEVIAQPTSDNEIVSSCLSASMVRVDVIYYAGFKRFGSTAVLTLAYISFVDSLPQVVWSVSNLSEVNLLLALVPEPFHAFPHAGAA